MVGRPGRDVEAVLDDIDDAAEAAGELVARGKRAWDEDRLLRLAGEAIIGRIADAASKLPDSVRAEADDVPWDDIRDMRIVVDHVYHRIDYEILWRTLEVDVPLLRTRLRRIRSREP
jgi:uncharacterized protein with HEPN domain